MIYVLIHSLSIFFFFFFFFNDTATTEIYTLSLHDALPIWPVRSSRSRTSSSRSTRGCPPRSAPTTPGCRSRSSRRLEEHTSELQSQFHLVCRLLLEKKKKKTKQQDINEHNTHHAPLPTANA